MPLTLQTPPQEAVAALAAALPRLAASPSIAARMKLANSGINRFVTQRAANPNAAPNVSAPLFVLGLADIAGDRGLVAVRHTGWRHLLEADTGAVLAETALRGTTHVFAAVNESPFAHDMQARLATLQQDQAVAAGSYQGALLQVPAMSVMALWLRGEGGSADIIVPLAPTPPPLVAGRHYSEADFLAALRPAAQAKLQADAPGKGA
jgi:hypothetical protein